MTFPAVGVSRIVGLALTTLLMTACALPQEKKIADVESELAPIRQAYTDCVVRVSNHYAKTDAGERDIITAGKTLCGSKIRDIREMLFDLDVEQRESQRYLNTLETDLRVIVLKTVRSERRKLQGANSN